MPPKLLRQKSLHRDRRRFKFSSVSARSVLLNVVCTCAGHWSRTMPVFRWGQNWDPFRDLEREVDRLLQGMNMSLQGRSNRRFPLINLRDLGAEFLLTAEIPGVDADSIEVTVSGGVLTIRGTRESPPEAREDTFRRQERFQGAWQRSVQLPDRIDEAEMKADYTAGILRITLPRSQDTISRTIPVTEGPAS